MTGAFSVDELIAAVRGIDPGVGTATVYRAIAVMTRAGFVERIGSRGGGALYARCEVAGHHHHLVCTRCGAVAHAPCPIDEATTAHAERSGFIVTAHEVSLYGLCGACARSGGVAR